MFWNNEKIESYYENMIAIQKKMVELINNRCDQLEKSIEELREQNKELHRNLSKKYSNIDKVFSEMGYNFSHLQVDIANLPQNQAVDKMRDMYKELAAKSKDDYLLAVSEVKSMKEMLKQALRILCNTKLDDESKIFPRGETERKIRKFGNE